MSAVIEATDYDRTLLCDLWVRSWQASGFDIDFSARRDWFLRHCAELVARHYRIHGIEVEGALTAFLLWSPLDGHIEQLAVDPAHQRKQLAAQLLAHAKAIRPQGLSLEVNQANLAALAFYRQQGFEVMGSGVNPLSGLELFRMRWGSGTK